MNIKTRVKKIALKNSNAALLTGTGRCGTSFLANALGALHPELHVEHEIEPTMIGIQNLNQQDQIEHIIKGRGRLAWSNWIKQRKSTALIESNCFLAPAAETFMSVWGNCKTIGVIRNWDACIESMASQTYSDSPHFFYANHDHQSGRRPNPVILGLMERKEWEQYERIEKIAWYWSYVNGHLLDLAEKDPKNVKLISFEMMKSETDAVLQEIQAFFQLPIRKLERKVATNSSIERKQRRLSLGEFEPEIVKRIHTQIKTVDERAVKYFTD